MQCLMSMPSTLRATWDIIQIINPLDLERDVPSALNECKVAARITNLRDIYELWHTGQWSEQELRADTSRCSFTSLLSQPELIEFMDYSATAEL